MDHNILFFISIIYVLHMRTHIHRERCVYIYQKTSKVPKISFYILFDYRSACSLN